MPPLKERDLHKAIKDRAFAPVYYFWGDDDFLKDAAVKQLVDAAVDDATRDFNFEVRRGADLDAAALDSLLGTPPMMAERRVVVVRDAGGLKKDARAALDRYLDRPAPDAIAVLTAPAGAKPDKPLCERAAAMEFSPLSGDRVPRWIAHHAAMLGASIAPAAIELLQNAAGHDLATLASELDKLASYANGAEIDEHAVADVVGVRRGETLGDLLDAVAARDGGRAYALVPYILTQPKMSGVTVVMALSTQTLALGWGQAMLARGTSRPQLARSFFDLLKAGGAYPGRSWNDAASAWTKYVDRWTPAAIDDALAHLLVAEVALKESRLSSEEQLLSSLVLAMSVG